MFGADKKYLTVSINDNVIKVAQASSSGNLERVARRSISENSSLDETVQTLKALLALFNRNLPVICVIPAGAATAKNIEVPSADPEEIKSIINLQSSRHTPYSREEVLISYVNLGLNAANNTRLLLVIAHRDVVKQRIDILEKAGLDIEKIIFAPEAQARFYTKNVSAKNASVQGILDIALNGTTYMVIVKGSLVFVRHIPIGIKALMEGADAAAKLQDEIKKSMDAFTQEEGGQPPSSYMVTTAREAVNNVMPGIQQALGITLQVKAFSASVKGAADVRKKLESDFGDDSFLDVIAPASTIAKCEINLMPEEIIMKKTVERQSKEVSKSGVAAVIIMVLVGAMIMSNIYFKDTFLNKNLREQFAGQRAEVQGLEAQMSKAKVVREYMKKRMASLDVIHELYAITPHSIYLSNIAVDDAGVITISGISESMSQVFSYVKSLDDSPMFKESKTKSTAVKKENGKDVAAFEIEFKLATNNPTKKESA